MKKVKNQKIKKVKFEDLDVKLQLLIYVRISSQDGPKTIFCTSNPKYFAAARELIAEGKIIEVENPGGSDRAFVLSESEKRKI